MHSADEERLRSRGYVIFRTRDAESAERMPHHHDFYKVELIWSGTAYYRVENRSYHLTNGDILLISPRVQHQRALDAEQTACERLVLWITREQLKRFRSLGFDLAACFREDQPDRDCCLRFDDEMTVHIGELMDRCQRENASEEFGSAIMADSYMVQAMILINRLFHRNAREERRDRSGTLVKSVLEYINSHFSEELTLDSLAGRFFISKYHLSREFGRLVGIPVHRYITQKRLVIAKQMLRDGRPSSMVCQHCGFGDYSNFYRAFRGEYGVSPKAYVATLREDAARGTEK